MKRLKTLCAVVGAAAMFSGASFAAEQKYDLPKYDPSTATKTIELYTEMTIMGPQVVAKEELKEGKKYNKQTYELFDRDKDGNIDLLKLELYQPELKIKDVEGYLETIKQAYGEELLKQSYGENYAEVISKMTIQEEAKQVFLAIDEEFNGGYDGYVERILMDVQNEKGEPFADGVFDQEEIASPRITDYIPPE